jgi:cytidylate kinase
VIIVGRGGQVMLQDQPDVLHVRIVAPTALRIHNIQADYALDDEQALEAIRAQDKASAEYLRHVFDADWADPTLYHLVLNTGKMDADTAVSLIIETARRVWPSLKD